MKTKKRSATPKGLLLQRAMQGDCEAFREFAGPREAKTLKEVAEFFGVAYSTVKWTWRRGGGMPGREGHWPLAEIAIWKADRIAAQRQANMSGRPVIEGRAIDRQRDANARKAEADAHAKEFKTELLCNNLMYREDVQREIDQCLEIAERVFRQIPDNLQAKLPKSVAALVAERVRGEIHRALKVLADLPHHVERLTPGPAPATPATNAVPTLET